MALASARPDWRLPSLGDFTVAVVAGAVCGLLAVVLSIGGASLVVANDFSAFTPLLIGPALLSAAIVTLVAALASSMKAATAPVQEIPCVAMGAIVGVLAGNLSTIDGHVPLTLMASLTVGTMVTGASMTILGVFRLGEIVRFIPFPVIGGFLAGTGWLILLGGLGLVLATPANIKLFASMPDVGDLMRMTAAGAVVLGLLVARRVYSGPMALPIVVFSGIALFNLAVLLAGSDHEALRAQGWLIAVPKAEWIPLAFEIGEAARIDWGVVAASMVGTPVLVVLATIGLLLNATSIELERQQDVDLNRELKAIGAGNMLAGVAGGLPGFQAISLSLLATKLGAESRLVGVVAAAVVFAVFMFGVSILDVFPIPVVGGMLIWLGGSLVFEWLGVRWRQVAGWDYAIVVLIFAVIVTIGFAEGVAVGLLAAVLLFAYQYSRLDLIRDEMSGQEYRSGVVGSTLPADWHEEQGRAILIVRLQGFLFFGTANRLRNALEERIRRHGEGGGRLIVVDFRRVLGIDSSATSVFTRLARVAERFGVTLVASGLDGASRHAPPKDDRLSLLNLEPDLESAVAWCEQALLAREGRERPTDETRPLATMLSDLVADEALAAAIASYCRRVVVGPGAALVIQGDPSKDLYFIESGHAAVVVTDERNSARVHLANVGAGDVIGEITFYLGDRRLASVVAKDEVVAWQLPREAMVQLSNEAPQAALRLHQSMATMLSRRLAHANRHIRRLADW